MTVSPAIPDFASLMGVEIDMFEDKHTIPAGAGRIFGKNGRPVRRTGFPPCHNR